MPPEPGHPTLRRTLILGNSGSGKSWLATGIAGTLGCRTVDLDDIHWRPGGYATPRDKQEALAMVRQQAAAPAWTIEGVFGWLAQEALPRATALIWLDLPIAECLANLRRRGPRGGGNQAAFDALLRWAAEYETRQTSSSHAGHLALFTAFPRSKRRLRTRTDADHTLAGLRASSDQPGSPDRTKMLG